MSLIHWEQLRKRLEGRPIQLGLERVTRVLDAGHLYPSAVTLTVAGTNGKGSTCAYLEQMLLRAGYRVGCYTSPHLLSFSERIRVDAINSSDEALNTAFDEVLGLPGADSLSQFEADTLAALSIFKRAAVDVVILEVGLGGRLDATNAVSPDVSVVTSIGIDHTEFLGTDREQIGFEKAGIFRASKPAICGDGSPPNSLIKQAELLGADLRLLGRDFGFELNPDHRQQWVYWFQEGGQLLKRSFAYPALRGGMQLQNAATALAALDSLADRLPVSMQARREGLIHTVLTGRFQVLPGQPTVILDVGHNPHAVSALARNLSEMGFFEHTYAVVGMLADKDAAESLRYLKGKIDHWFCAELSGPRGSPASRLTAVIEEGGLGGTWSEHPSPAAALAKAQEAAGLDDRIVAFGSFHTVADTLTLLRP